MSIIQSFIDDWKLKKWEKRLEAVSELTDQDQLAHIAENDPDEPIRLAAINKLTDETVLARAAEQDVDEAIRLAALSRIVSQSVLKEVARTASSFKIREAAVQKLEDADTLAAIALEDENYCVRLAAVEQLGDHPVLSEVALKDEHSSVRIHAVELLTDQATLEQVALRDEFHSLRVAAVKRITKRELLDEVAKTDDDIAVRQVAQDLLAIGELTEESRADIESHVRDHDLDEALEKLDQTDNFEEARDILRRIFSRREEAAGALPAVLLKIFTTPGFTRFLHTDVNLVGFIQHCGADRVTYAATFLAKALKKRLGALTILDLLRILKDIEVLIEYGADGTEAVGHLKEAVGKLDHELSVLLDEINQLTSMIETVPSSSESETETPDSPDESVIVYKVVFRGVLLEGQALEDVQNRVAELFKVNEEVISRLFCGRPIVVHKATVRELAEKYVYYMEQAGAYCEIVVQ